MNKIYGQFFEEFKEGEIIKHDLTKTICESDNNLFALLTLNHHPIHLNEEFAKKSQHGKILVVGTYVFSMVVGISVADISGKAIANLGYNEIKHFKPVFIGDTINAQTKILKVRESNSKLDRGIISVLTEAFNQHGDLVISFERNVLIKKK